MQQLGCKTVYHAAKRELMRRQQAEAETDTEGWQEPLAGESEC